MTLRPRLLHFAPLPLVLASLPLAAQELVAPPAASPTACAAVTSDAARLACYDQLFGPNTASTAEADAAARAAAEERRQARRSDRLSQGEQRWARA